MAGFIRVAILDLVVVFSQILSYVVHFPLLEEHNTRSWINTERDRVDRYIHTKRDEV